MAAARKPTAIIAAVAIVLAASAGIAYAHGDGHDLLRTVYSRFDVEDEIKIKKGSAVTVYSLKLDPGKHAPWHYHPGPHIVSVKTGSVRVYETDCSYREYPAGTGFYDPGQSGNEKPHVHTLWNPPTGSEEGRPTGPVAEVVITDVRTDDPRLAIVVEPQPAFCF